MKDQVEDFIRRNRNAFDDKEPPEKVWKSIDHLLFSSKGTAWYNSLVVWRAAALLFMALSVYLLIPKFPAHSQNQNDIALEEFTDVESFYVRQISEKVRLIDGFGRNDGLNGFTKDFQQLEAMYLVLKEEMKNGSSQKVKDALVLNLLVQIDLLNQQLHKLEKEYKPQQQKPKSNT